MELVKNKASGKPFIVLDDSGRARFVLITPEGKIKTLERRLFAPLEMTGAKAGRTAPQLTKPQMTRYAEELAAQGVEDGWSEDMECRV